MAKIPYPELRGSLDGMQYPAFVEPKIDGEFNICHYDELVGKGGEAWLSNKYARIRNSLPFLVDLAGRLHAAGVIRGVFLGELYVNTGANGELYNLLKNKENAAALKYKIFDFNTLVFKDGTINGDSTPLIDRKEVLLELLNHTTTIMLPIRSEMVHTKEEVMVLFKHYTDMGFEGIVVKPARSFMVYGPCSWVKIKNKDQTDYEVMFIDPIKERIEIKAPVVATNGKVPITYIPVGCKCQNKDKAKLKVGDFVTIEHQGVLPSGSLRHPVFIKKGDTLVLIPTKGEHAQTA